MDDFLVIRQNVGPVYDRQVTTSSYPISTPPLPPIFNFNVAIVTYGQETADILLILKAEKLIAV